MRFTPSDQRRAFPVTIYAPSQPERDCNGCGVYPVEIVAVLRVRDHVTRFCASCFDRLSDAVRSFDGRTDATGADPDYRPPVDPGGDPEVAEAAARAEGVEDGRAAGSWVIDGNTTPETARRILRGIDDGDPEILDMEPSPLSGEWAGEPTPDTVLESVGIDREDDRADDVLQAYELGFSEGYWNQVETDARSTAGTRTTTPTLTEGRS